MKIIICISRGSAVIISITVPCEEMNVLGSRLKASTSAKRLTA